MKLIWCIAAFFSVFAIQAQSLPGSNEVLGSKAKQSQFQAGLHYDLITPAWSAEDDAAVVYEFFSYMCPGCNGFEPIMQKLEEKISESQKIVRVPVAFYAQWEPHAKAFHALKMMGHLDQTHEALFAAIHQYKKPLRNLDDIAKWLDKSFKIDAQKFLSTAASFAVDSQLRKDKQMAQAMGVGGVPTLVVNGRYKPNFDHLKTSDEILEITTYLLDLE